MRAFRFDVPIPVRPTMSRPRLSTLLDERWERRVVTIVAGPGFGKSTLVAAAIEANALDGRGDDHWLGVDAADRDAGRLGRDLLSALGSGPDPDEVADGIDELAAAIAASVWARSPRPVCLVLDDVHEIEPTSDGARLLDELTRAMPGNGHLVLVSRTEPPVALARLRAQGQVTSIAEDQLAFSREEVARFAELRDVPGGALGDLGGWPALVELRADTAGAEVSGFVAEEVLAGRSPDEIAAIETLALVGEADHHLLSALTGRQVGADQLANLMTNVPLSVHDERGNWALHRLWRTAVDDRIEHERRNQVIADAARALVDRDPTRAVHLAVTIGDDATARAGLRSLLSTPWEGLQQAESERLHRSLAEPLAGTNEGRLLLAAVLSAASPVDAQQVLRSVAERATSDGDHSLATLAVERLVVIASRRQDIVALADAFERVAALDAAGGDDRVDALVVLREALAADMNGDADAALAALDRLSVDRLDAYWRAPIAWMRAQATLALGYPSAALRHSEVALELAPPSLRCEFTMLHVNALVLDGRPDEAMDEIAPMLQLLDELGTIEARATGHGQFAQRLAVCGRADDARRELAVAIELAGPQPTGPLRVNSLAAELMIAIAEFDEERAGALLAESLREQPLAGGRQLYSYRRRLALVYVLAPSTRSFWDDAELGPAFTLQRDVARALVDVRTGSTHTAARLSAERWAMGRAVLPLPWLCELAIAGATAGNGDADRILKELDPEVARPALREVAERSRGPQAKRARAALAAMPMVPPHVLSIEALGPLALRHDDEPVLHDAWRRERVRSLLAYLVCRRQCTRDEASAALWPDLDDAAASRNLRVTLSYLHTVMEPDRETGQPPFFVRSDGDRLSLTGGEHLRVDVDRFESALDAAATYARDRSPADEHACLVEAVGLYRGAFLADVRAEDWLVEHRDRLLVRFVDAAVRAGELSRARGELDEARHLAERAVAEDPWSEAARRLLGSVHLDRGDRSAARRSLDACLSMLEELGVTPEPETEALIRRLDG